MPPLGDLIKNIPASTRSKEDLRTLPQSQYKSPPPCPEVLWRSISSLIFPHTIYYPNH